MKVIEMTLTTSITPNGNIIKKNCKSQKLQFTTSTSKFNTQCRKQKRKLYLYVWPIAEGVFRKIADNQWEIDSAAIGGWHAGNPPDRRALDTMKKHDVPYNNCARQIKPNDFNYYDYIFGMDDENMRDLNRKAPKGSKAKLLLFGDFDPQGDRIIRDPYYDNDSQGFEKCYEQSVRCSHGFLEQLAQGKVE